MALLESKAAVFWARVERSRGEEACWEWMGPRHRTLGYGFFVSAPLNVGAHRFAWALENGMPPPMGEDICHRCDNPPCVNPAHLFSGTRKQNMEDSVAKGRMHRGERSGPSKLKTDQVLEIRRRHQVGASIQGLAREYGLSGETVHGIVHRRYWRHVA
jgi:hypothetical protein